MADQAELDRLMAQATGQPPAPAAPDPSLVALAQDAVTANQPLPGAAPAGMAAPAPDPVDAALAAAQAAPATPGAPVAVPPGDAPLARQIPDGSAQVAPGTSLGAEGPVFTPQDAGAPPAAKWAGADAPGAPPSGAAVAPASPAADAPVVGAHGVSFKEAGRQLDRAEQAGQRAADATIEAGKTEGQMAADKAQSHRMIADEIRGQVVERNAIETARAEGVARAQQMADEAQKKLDSFSYHDYFGTHKDANGNEVPNPGGSKTLARVFSFISGFNVGAYGAPDIAYRNITAGIERDMQRQKADLALEQDRAKRAGEHVKDTAALFDSQLAMLDLKHANLLKATAEEAEAFAMQRGDADAQARAKVISEKLKAEWAQKHAEGIEKLASSQASIAMAGAHLALARQTAEATRQDKKDKAAAGEADRNSASEVRDVDGNVLGNAPMVGTRLNPEVAHADNRVGNAKALIGAFGELKEDVAAHGNNLIPGTVDYRNRERLIANIQAAKRVAEQLPASEGGLHLEESQMPGSGSLFGLSTSPELIDKTIAGIRDKVNTQNKAIVHPQRGAPKTSGDASTSNAPPPSASGAPDRLALALKAVDDPEASPKEKAQAKKIVIQAKQAGQLR